MEIILAKNIGFCDGVENSIEQTLKLLNSDKELYCLGNLVHNDKVINELKDKGLIVVDKIPNTTKLVIRAHGISKDVYEKAKQKNIELIDLTCPKVIGIHEMAKKLSKDYYIILIGNKLHPEVIGTISFCGENSIIIQDESDLEKLEIGNDKIAIIGQTTYSLTKFNNLCTLIKKKFNNKEIKVFNTLCSTTKNRQEEASNLAAKVDIMLVIGDKKSSNTNKLFEVANKINNKSFLIEDLNDFINQDIVIKKDDIVGIITGASTPKSFAIEIKNYLQSKK